MATMPLGTGAELSTGQRAACQYHNLLQKTTSMGSGGSRTEDRRYDAGAGRFISEDFIKGHTAVPYTMNHYSYCFNRPMDLVDLNGMWPTAVVTSDLAGMDTKSEELDESDPVHIASDLYTMGDNLCRAGELGKYGIDWGVQYATNKNLQNTLKTSQSAKKMATLEGISLGRYRRTTKARITDGAALMGNIGETAKFSCKLGKGDILGIGLDVGVGIGLFVAYVDDSDSDGNGKSLRDDIKDIVYGLVSGENGEKE